MTLDGAGVPYEVRETTRGDEVLVEAAPAGGQTLTVWTDAAWAGDGARPGALVSFVAERGRTVGAAGKTEGWGCLVV